MGTLFLQRGRARGRNPFVNQVSSFNINNNKTWKENTMSRNPFVNQVSSFQLHWVPAELVSPERRNPFVNQVSSFGKAQEIAERFGVKS
jgi:hypothetical protein